MELASRPRGRIVRTGGLAVAGVLVGAAVAVLGYGKAVTVPITLVGGLQATAAVACAWTLHRCYAQPARKAS